MLEFIKSIWLETKERVRNPLIGPLVIAWILGNYELLIIVFSSEDPAWKFTLIEDLYPVHWWSYFKSIAGPLLSTLFYIYLFPYPASMVYDKIRSTQNDMKLKKLKYDKEEPVSQREVSDLVSNHHVRESISAKTIKELQTTVSEQKDTIAGLQKEIELHESKGQMAPDELTKASEALLAAIKQPDEKTPKSHQANIDFIPTADRAVIIRKILVNLKNDSQKLEYLIPLLQDDSYKDSIDPKYQLDSKLEPLGDWLTHLTCDPISKINNENEIDQIRKWLELREQVNGKLKLLDRVEYINQNASLLRATLSDLIKFYEK